MRLGIFGGSFDPVHNGHLALARACQRQAALDEVWFTPAATQPLKQPGPHANDSHRLAMLELATAAEPGWKLCRLEIERGGVSYTVDTLRTIHAERPGDSLFVLFGGDALSDLHHWKEPAEIFCLATPLVVRRAGEAPSNLATLNELCTAGNSPRPIDMPPVDVSSSEIRRRIAAGEPIDALVPLEVGRYITQHGLYR
jgi:nicotinate-nucleotide adenylyltransferase